MSNLLRILWVVLGFMSSISLLGCNRQTDYYSRFMQNGCHPEEAVLTDECRRAILSQGNLDIPDFQNHPETLDSVMRGLHLLMHGSFAFPKDKKMFGLATLEQAQMYDFIDTLVPDEQKNFNQLLVNYVLNAAPMVSYGCIFGKLEASYYTPWGIHICDSFTISQEKYIDSISVAQVLLHEARHQSGDHVVFCKDILECDKGMDGPHGWEIALVWGMLQGGNRVQVLPSDQTAENLVLERMYPPLDSIFALPSLLTIVKDKTFKNTYAHNISEVEQLWATQEAKQSSFDIRSIPLPKIAKVSQIQTGDFNGDGKLDLALAADDQVHIFLNQGAAQFSTPVSSSFPNCKEITNLLAADFDGDHFLDLMAVCDSIVILWGSGDGNFKAQYHTDTYASSPIQVADFNQDQKADFAFVSNPWSIKIFLSTMGRSFRSLDYLPDEGTAHITGSLSIVDINQDHIPDLAFPTVGESSANYLGIYRGSGDGNFTQNLEPEYFYAGESGSKIRILNLDNDALPEILISQPDPLSTDYGLQFLSKVEVPFFRFPHFSLPFSPNQKIEAVDLNRDGNMDLIGFDQNNWVVSYGYHWPEVRSAATIAVDQIPSPYTIFDFVIGDWNQDGWPDMVLLRRNSSAGELLLFLGKPIDL